MRVARFPARGSDERHVSLCLVSRQARVGQRRVSVWAAESKEQLEAEMIKEQRNGYRVVSSKGKNLGGPYKILEEAKQRLRQVEFFKRRGANTKRVTRRKF